MSAAARCGALAPRAARRAPLSRTHLPLALAALALAPGQVHAGDAARGFQLAERWCVACHVIAPNIAGGDAGPAFPALAERPETSEQALALWLADPHPPMPDPGLGGAEIADLAAYISGLSP